MTDFITPFDQAVYTTLTGSTALTGLLNGGTASPSVYHWIAPTDAAPPYVIYNVQTDVPVKTLPTQAIENKLYQVRAVTFGPTAAAAGTIANQIDAALNGAALSISGYTLLLCRREEGINYPELAPGGQRYHNAGAIYRIQAQPS